MSNTLKTSIKHLYTGSLDVREQAMIDLKIELDNDLVEISNMAKARYLEGVPVIVKDKSDVISSDIVEFRPEDGRLVIAANARRAALHGADAPQKTALTNPEGTAEAQLVNSISDAIQKLKSRGQLPDKVDFGNIDNK